MNVRMLISLAIMLVALPGCASKYGEKNTAVYYYPACYAPLQDLHNRENEVTKGTSGGAAIGAISGALIGLITSGGKLSGAAIGSVTGGVTGGLAGNASAMSRKEAENNRRLSQYLENIEGDITGLDVNSAAATYALECYDRQFDALLQQIREGAISRESADQRFAEICRGREEAIAILGNAAQQSRDLYQQYDAAIAAGELGLQKDGEDGVSEKQARRDINAARRQQEELGGKARAFDEGMAAARANTKRQTKEMNWEE